MAAHWDVAAEATVEGLQTTDTEEIAVEVVWGLEIADPPPQLETTNGIKQAKMAKHRSFLSRMLPELHWRLPIKAPFSEGAFSCIRGDMCSNSGRSVVHQHGRYFLCSEMHPGENSP